MGQRLQQRRDQSQAMTQKQHQLLMMLPEMQQSLQVLQYPVMELALYLEEELIQNPLLESESIDEEVEIEATPSDDGELDFEKEDFSVVDTLDEVFEDFFKETWSQVAFKDEKKEDWIDKIPASTSFNESLMAQGREVFLDPTSQEIASFIIGSLNKSGLLDCSIEEVAALTEKSFRQVEDVLRIIQTFDPPGVGAKNVQEALLIQLERVEKGKTTSATIIADYYDDLLHNRIPSIAKGLALTEREVIALIEKDILPLSLAPSSSQGSDHAAPIIADALIWDEGGHLLIEMNDEPLPKLFFSLRYLKMINDESLSQEIKDYLKEKLFHAKHLMKNVFLRESTLRRILDYLIKVQGEFLRYPEGSLVPLSMADLAGELSLHESTIARAVQGKYIYAPRGMVLLRSLFTVKYMKEDGSEISASTIRSAMKKLISEEDKSHPLSDQKISLLLKDQGIACARRTIAKYRGQLAIGNTQERRKY